MSLFLRKKSYIDWMLKTEEGDTRGFSYDDLLKTMKQVVQGKHEFLIVESLKNGAYMQAAGNDGRVHLEIRVDKANGGFLLFGKDGYAIKEAVDILDAFMLGKAMPDLNDGWYVVFEGE